MEGVTTRRQAGLYSPVGGLQVVGTNDTRDELINRKNVGTRKGLFSELGGLQAAQQFVPRGQHHLDATRQPGPTPGAAAKPPFFTEHVSPPSQRRVPSRFQDSRLEHYPGGHGSHDRMYNRLVGDREIHSTVRHADSSRRGGSHAPRSVQKAYTEYNAALEEERTRIRLEMGRALKGQLDDAQERREDAWRVATGAAFEQSLRHGSGHHSQRARIPGGEAEWPRSYDPVGMDETVRTSNNPEDYIVADNDSWDRGVSAISDAVSEVSELLDSLSRDDSVSTPPPQQRQLEPEVAAPRAVKSAQRVDSRWAVQPLGSLGPLPSSEPPEPSRGGKRVTPRTVETEVKNTLELHAQQAERGLPPRAYDPQGPAAATDPQGRWALRQEQAALRQENRENGKGKHSIIGAGAANEGDFREVAGQRSVSGWRQAEIDLEQQVGGVSALAQAGKWRERQSRGEKKHLQMDERHEVPSVASNDKDDLLTRQRLTFDARIVREINLRRQRGDQLWKTCISDPSAVASSGEEHDDGECGETGPQENDVTHRRYRRKPTMIGGGDANQKEAPESPATTQVCKPAALSVRCVWK